MSDTASRHERRAHGVLSLLATHPRVRQLMRSSAPSIHGTRQWPSSWLLIDYLSRHPPPPGSRVIEVGAGWGLAGIFCAKRLGCRVLAVDKDPSVRPFLELHAERNGVEISFMRSDFAGLTRRLLGGFDVLLGSDICFWRSLIPEVRRLVLRALGSGVHTALIADPGRHTFERMASGLSEHGKAELIRWRCAKPFACSGRILRAAPGLPVASRRPYTARS